MKEKLGKISPAICIIGLLAVLIGTIIPLFAKAVIPAAAYCYAAGALVLLFGRITAPQTSTDIRLRRLKRMETWAAIIFCVGAFFLFFDHGTFRDVLAFTLAGAILQVYVTLRTPSVAAKADKNSNLHN